LGGDGAVVGRPFPGTGRPPFTVAAAFPGGVLPVGGTFPLTSFFLSSAVSAAAPALAPGAGFFLIVAVLPFGGDTAAGASSSSSLS